VRWLWRTPRGRRRLARHYVPLVGLTAVSTDLRRDVGILAAAMSLMHVAWLAERLRLARTPAPGRAVGV
jgi:hypothetical protein